MQETIGYPQASAGIWHRIFSYILNVLYARRLKHLEMDDHPLSDDDRLIEVPIGGSSSREAEEVAKFSPSRPNWDSEIVLEFRHGDEELENRKNSVRFANADGLDQTAINKKPIQEQTDHSKVQPGTAIRSNDKGSRKKVIINGAAEEKEKYQKKKEKKEKKIRTNQTTSINQPPGRSRAFASVISNINEKSEEFIRSRKEAMRRNYYTLESEKH